MNRRIITTLCFVFPGTEEMSRKSDRNQEQEWPIKSANTSFWESKAEAQNGTGTNCWLSHRMPDSAKRTEQYINYKAAPAIQNPIDAESMSWESVAAAYFFQASSTRVEPWTFEEMLRLSKHIGLNKLRNEIKRITRQKHNLAIETGNELDPPDPQSESLLEERTEFVEEVASAKSSLTPVEQRVAELHRQKLTYKEIAAEMGASLRSIERLVDQIDEKLHDHLDMRKRTKKASKPRNCKEQGARSKEQGARRS